MTKEEKDLLDVTNKIFDMTRDELEDGLASCLAEMKRLRALIREGEISKKAFQLAKHKAALMGSRLEEVEKIPEAWESGIRWE